MSETKQTAAARIEANRLEEARVSQLLARSEDGKLLLKMLEDLYYKGSMLGAKPEETYFNLGRREVVDFLLNLRDKAKE